MAYDKGLGSCMIPRENGLPCGGQIQEGEPIGTVIVGMSSRVGHRRCYNDYYQRKQQEERDTMVKRINQAGPGGPVDPTTATDAIMGSIPLVPKDNTIDTASLSNTAAPMAQRSVADLPFEEEPGAMRNTHDGELPPPGASAWSVEEVAQFEALRDHLIAQRPKPVTPDSVNQRLDFLVGLLVAKGVINPEELDS